MKIQEIENALLRQLPFKKQHLPVQGLITKDFSPENVMLIICGLSSVYIPNPKTAITEFYDIKPKEYDIYVYHFLDHLDRVNEIMRAYGVNTKLSDHYEAFSNAFWRVHNPEGQNYKLGTLLSHILSSKREFREFLKKETIFKEGDFTSFFVYNKSRLTRNCLFLASKETEYVDFLDMAF
jgi:hypothetical protein